MRSAAALAYRDAPEQRVSPVTPALSLIEATIPALSPLELLAVSIGRADPRSSRFAPGKVRRGINTLFGFKPINMLADPHLEALRVLAIGLSSGRRREVSGSSRKARDAALSDECINLVAQLVQDRRPAT